MTGVGAVSRDSMGSGLVEKSMKMDSKSPKADVSKGGDGANVSSKVDAGSRVVTETLTLSQGPKENTKELTKSAGQAKGEDVRPDTANNPVSPQKSNNAESQKYMTQLNSKDANPTSIHNDTVKMTKGKSEDNPNQSNHFSANQGSAHGVRFQDPTAASFQTPVSYKRRRDEDDDAGDGRRRRRKPANLQNQGKIPSMVQGAHVGESQTQDMFVSSSTTAARISATKLNKSVIEQMKEYSLGLLGSAVFDTVSENVNFNEKNGIGQNMQKELFTLIARTVSEINYVMTPEYRKYVREVVQGTMQAASQHRLDYKDMIKIIVSGLMATSPHEDNTEIMGETAKIIVSELMYGKVNIGYNMRDASNYIGAALYTLTMYYKNYQSEVAFSKELEHKLTASFSDGIWRATGELSNFAQSAAKSNIEHFTTGRLDEEKAFQKNLVKGMVLSPLKKVFNR